MGEPEMSVCLEHLRALAEALTGEPGVAGEGAYLRAYTVSDQQSLDRLETLLVTANADLTELTAAIVASFVSHNALPADELPAFISSTHAALAALRGHVNTLSGEPGADVPISESVTNDFLVCLEDGHKLRSLKRYLKRKYGMSPEQYRAKWGLPKDYPMVAPAYSALRSLIARRRGPTVERVSQLDKQ
jgi:predicted transcriptional regulator